MKLYVSTITRYDTKSSYRDWIRSIFFRKNEITGRFEWRRSKNWTFLTHLAVNDNVYTTITQPSENRDQEAHRLIKMTFFPMLHYGHDQAKSMNLYGLH